MLAFLQERVSVWQRILDAAQAGQPLALYGMGDGADKILAWCQAHSVQLGGIFASPGFVRHQNFHGFTVESYQEVVARLGVDCLILIAFASERPEVLAAFAQLDRHHPGGVLAPHLPLYQEEEVFDLAYLARHEEELTTVYQLLADDASRAVLAAVLNYKLSGKISYLQAVYSRRRQDLEQLLQLGPEESYLDLGAYDGDTVEEFLQLTGGRYRHILAVEPDQRNYRRLQAYVEQRGLEGVDPYPGGLWKEAGLLPFSATGGRQSSLRTRPKASVPVTTLDLLAGELAPSYIKLDVEGAEYEVLQGGAATIRKYRPKLLVAAYHYDGDCFRLPLYLRSLVPSYRFYLRQHPYVPAWELNYFVLPPA